MKVIDTKCTQCCKISRDLLVEDGEVGFDIEHACPECGGIALRAPNKVAIRGCDTKGTEKNTYVVAPGKRKAEMEALLLENELREAAEDSFDTQESRRLHREADKVAGTKEST